MNPFIIMWYKDEDLYSNCKSLNEFIQNLVNIWILWDSKYQDIPYVCDTTIWFYSQVCTQQLMRNMIGAEV